MGIFSMGDLAYPAKDTVIQSGQQKSFFKKADNGNLVPSDDTTRGIQPQNDGEGSIGIPDCKWEQGCFNEVILPEGNILDVIEQAVNPSNALQFCRRRSIVKKTSTVELKWQEPENSSAVWKKTVIVKKQGSYPENDSDGTVVVVNTVRNQYAKSAFIDTQENNADWYYRAFPVSSNDVVSYHELNKFGFWIYGCYIDEEDAVESTCVHSVPDTDNYDYASIKMVFAENADDNKLDWGDWEDAPFMPKPCMLKSNGVVDYYLNPDDLTKKVDGTASDVENTSYDGNAMMEWSPVFMKVERKYNRIYLYFSSHKIDDDYECYSAKKADGTYGEHFYLPIFEGSVIDSKLRSIATNAKPTVDTTASDELTYATNNGDGWLPTTWADENLLQCLGILVMGRLNSQVAIGYNCGESTSALTHNVGSGKQKGMFWGHYTTSAHATKFFGMENWWGHRWRRCVGLMLKEGSYEVIVKMTRSKIDGSGTAEYNNTGDNYISTGITVPAASNAFFTNVAGSKYGVCIPTATTRYVSGVTVGGSSTTFFCDVMWSNRGLTQLCLGGGVNYSSPRGLFNFTVHSPPSYYDWNFGASLTYRNF